MRSFISTLTLAMIVLITAWQPQKEPAFRPNILFISIDDLHLELGGYGNTEIITPDIDNFASQGAVFRRTYSQEAVCAPSRASLMTGLRPDSTRVWHLGEKLRHIN